MWSDKNIQFTFTLLIIKLKNPRFIDIIAFLFFA